MVFSEIEIIVALIFGVVIGQSLSFKAIKSTVSTRTIDNKLDAIIDYLGVEFDPYKNIPHDILQSIKEGNRVKAMKLYRLHTGASLKEARSVIADLEERNKS